MSRYFTTEHTFLDAKAAAGVGTAMNVTDFQHLVATIQTDGGSDAALTVKCQGSIAVTEPTWGSAASVTNPWFYIGMGRMGDNVGISGQGSLDYSFTVATTDSHMIYEIYSSSLRWINFVVTARTEGEVTVKGVGVSNT